MLTNFLNYIKCFQIHITLKSSPIQYYCFVCWSPRAGSGRVPRKATDFARDLQLVHHHFCILQKECGKLEGTEYSFLKNQNVVLHSKMSQVKSRNHLQSYYLTILLWTPKTMNLDNKICNGVNQNTNSKWRCSWCLAIALLFPDIYSRRKRSRKYNTIYFVIVTFLGMAPITWSSSRWQSKWAPFPFIPIIAFTQKYAKVELWNTICSQACVSVMFFLIFSFTISLFRQFSLSRLHDNWLWATSINGSQQILSTSVPLATSLGR